MARQIVVLTLVLFAVIGYASAAAEEAPTHSPGGDGAALAPVSGNDDSIGNTDDDASAPSGNGGGGDEEVVAGPVGSETGLGPSGETPNSGGSSALKVSAAAGVAGVAGFFFF